MKSELQKTFYNPAQKPAETETQRGMNGKVDCMEKWFWEAQSDDGTLSVNGIPYHQNETLYVSGIPCERSKPFVKNFLRDNIPNAADIRVPMGRVGGTIKGLAFVRLSPGVNVKDVLKQVKNLKMGSRRLQITELSGGGFGNGNSSFDDDNYRPSTPQYRPSPPTPIRMQSPVMFEK